MSLIPVTAIFGCFWLAVIAQFLKPIFTMMRSRAGK